MWSFFKDHSDAHRYTSGYLVFRFLIAFLLFLIVLIPEVSEHFNIKSDFNLTLLSSLYLASVILPALAMISKKVEIKDIANLMSWIDRVLLPLLMLFTYKLAYPLGYMFILTILFANLILRISIIRRGFIANLIIIFSQLLAGVTESYYSLALEELSALIILLLASTYLSWLFIRYMQSHESKLQQQTIDLQNLNEVNQFIFQQLPTGALVINSDFEVILINDSARTLLPDKTTKTNQHLGAYDEKLHAAVQDWVESESNGVNSSYQDDSAHYEASFLKFGQGKNQGVLISLQDQSYLNKRAQEIKWASLGQLTAGVAHEIRNPLNAISQATQLLKEDNKIDSMQKKMFAIITAQTKRMKHLVDDVFSLSRGTLQKPKAIQIESWLSGFIAQFLDSYPEAIIYFSPPEKAITLRFISEHLHQILWNLATNAVEHARVDANESVVIDIYLTETKNQKAVIHLCDNGKPIEDAHQSRLFDPFFTTQNTGSGLGLYLARELAIQNGAQLRFDNQMTTNCFCLEVPRV